MEHRAHLLREGLIDCIDEPGLPISVNLDEIGPNRMLKKPLQISRPRFSERVFCPGIALIYNALQQTR